MCITRIMLAPIAGLLLALPAAAKDIDRMTLEERIVQVVYNTVHQKQFEDAPPDDVVDRWRLAGTGDIKVYEYNIGDLEDDDYKRIGWRFQVRVLPPDWKPDPASQAKWAEKAAGIDKQTEGERAFLESQRGVRRTKVYFRLRSGTIKLVMSITREGKETQDEAIRKAERRWQFFVSEAERYGLFERARIIVVALPPVDARGNAISDDPIGDRGEFGDGEFVSIVHSHKEQVDLPLRVQVEAPGIADDEPYELRVAFKDVLGRPGVVLVDGMGQPLANRDPKGRFIVQVPRGDTPAALSIRFGVYSVGYGAGLRNQVLDQLAQAQFQYLGKPKAAGTDVAAADPDPKAKLDIAVQRGDWWPVVTRFEIKTKFVSDSPGFRRKKEGEFKEDRFRGSFNAFRIVGADLKAGWDKLLPLVRARPGYPEGASASFPVFKKVEPVILGWRRHPRTPGSFFTAESSPERPWVPGFKKGRQSFHLLVDVEIVSPSPPPSNKTKTEKTRMFFDDDGDAEFGDPFAAEREIRRFINVGDYKLTIRRLAEQGVGVPPGAKPGAAHERFARIIRMPSGAVPMRKGGKEREVILEQRRSGGQSLDSYFRLEAHRQEALQYREVYCTPGVYELRLYLDLYYKEPDNSKKIEVALRYNCVDTGFGVDALSKQSQRLTRGRRP